MASPDPESIVSFQAAGEEKPPPAKCLARLVEEVELADLSPEKESEVERESNEKTTSAAGVCISVVDHPNLPDSQSAGSEYRSPLKTLLGAMHGVSVPADESDGVTQHGNIGGDRPGNPRRSTAGALGALLTSLHGHGAARSSSAILAELDREALLKASKKYHRHSSGSLVGGFEGTYDDRFWERVRRANCASLTNKRLFLLSSVN